MRRTLTLATVTLATVVSLVFVANPALAAKKAKPGKKSDSGATAAQTWTDPTEKETSDKGPFTPQSKAEEPPPAPKETKLDPGRKRDKVVVFGDILIGFGKAPLPGPDIEGTSGKATAVTLQLGGQYDVSKAATFGLRIPWTTATVRQSNGKNLAANAFGAPELFGEYRIGLSRLTTVPITFGIGIPLAQGTMDVTSNDGAAASRGVVNRMADAASGWRDSELFQSKHLPLVVGGGIRHERRDFELHAHAKFVFLPALSKTIANPGREGLLGTYESNSVALREVTTLGGSYDFLSDPRVYASLELAVVWSPIDAVEFAHTAAVTLPSRLQAVLLPRVGARFGRISPSVGYVAPLGGHLGGAGVGGLDLHLDVSL
jgi:hypothetical protein